MSARKTQDENEAREHIAKMRESGLTQAAWARSAGPDGRSLHARNVNLSRGDSNASRETEGSQDAGCEAGGTSADVDGGKKRPLHRIGWAICDRCRRSVRGGHPSSTDWCASVMLSLPPTVRVFIAVRSNGHAWFIRRSRRCRPTTRWRPYRRPHLSVHEQAPTDSQGGLFRWLWLVGHCVPPLNGTQDQIQVDGPTLTSLLAGMDFTASRRGRYRKNRHDERESRCNAHGRRTFRDAEETQPVLAIEGGEFIGVICGDEEKAQQLGLNSEALLEHRRRFIGPIAKDFEGWMKAV